MSTQQRLTKKRRRQCETCIQCRSSRKQCDKGNPCRNCAENNCKCLYAKEFPYSNLSQEQQAIILEQLLYETKAKYTQLKKYIEKLDLTEQQTPANSKRQLGRYTVGEVDMYNILQQHLGARMGKISSQSSPDWQLQDRVFHTMYERNSSLLTLIDDLDKETVSTSLRPLESNEFPIDIARALVSVEEVDMLIAMYNDCFSFSSLPDFITPHLDENGDYDLLLGSVMTLMLSHAVNLHSMKVDNHDHLSHAFYHYTRDLLSTRMTTLHQPDIMCLHTTFNLMLYENENGYLDEAKLSRQSMAVMIDCLHNQYTTMSVWQQGLLRHLFWAIYNADASTHNLEMQTHVINSSYMQIGRQQPSEYFAQPLDRLKEEYIYYQCRLTTITHHIDTICYQHTPGMSTFPISSPSTENPSTTKPPTSASPALGNTLSSPLSQQQPFNRDFTSPANMIRGEEIKTLENELWDLYHELPDWVTDGQPLESVQLSNLDGYRGGKSSTRPSIDPCVHNRAHPVCKRTLEDVWMRRLRYHFLSEWHGTFLYLHQICLPPPSGDIMQLSFMRCLEHGQCMVDILTQWANDGDFFDCYCYPAPRSLVMASNIYKYFLQSNLQDIQHKGHELLLQLFTVIQRTNIYHLYKDTPFILGIQDTFDRIRQNYIQHTTTATSSTSSTSLHNGFVVSTPVMNLGHLRPQGATRSFDGNLTSDGKGGDNSDNLYVYPAAAS
ncbi:unnamed protein product [Absidia cylindrospora]